MFAAGHIKLTVHSSAVFSISQAGCSRCVAAAVAAALGGRRGAELGFWLVGEAVDENCGRTCGSGGSHGEIQIGESPPLQA